MLEFLLPDGVLSGEPPHCYAVIGGGAGRAIPQYDGSRRAAPEGATALIVVLEPGGEADTFLSTYDSTGGFIQDSWYLTREEALEAAAAEFGTALGTWHPVPAGTDDPELFVLRNAEF
jgi:hypothetical protein